MSDAPETFDPAAAVEHLTEPDARCLQLAQGARELRAALNQPIVPAPAPKPASLMVGLDERALRHLEAHAHEDVLPDRHMRQQLAARPDQAVGTDADAGRERDLPHHLHPGREADAAVLQLPDGSALAASIDCNESRPCVRIPASATSTGSVSTPRASD